MTSLSNFLNNHLPSLNTKNCMTAERAFGALAKLDGITLHDCLQGHRMVEVSAALSTRGTVGGRAASTAGGRAASTAGGRAASTAGGRAASTAGGSTGSHTRVPLTNDVGETNDVESSISSLTNPSIPVVLHSRMMHRVVAAMCDSQFSNHIYHRCQNNSGC